jgi:penicillin amidase
LLRRSLAFVAALVAVLLVVAWTALYASLPRRSGEARVAELESPVAIALDARAIATVRGETFLDALRGQGFLHAQERYFQMDLLRRSSAGELSELFG